MTSKYLLLHSMPRLRVTHWFPLLVLLASLSITYWLWKYEQAEEIQRLTMQFKMPSGNSASSISLSSFDSTSFSLVPLDFVVYGIGISILLSLFTWLILRSRDSILSMAGVYRENEQRWKLALEGAGDGVWDWNLSTGHVIYSRRLKEMLGFTEDEIGNSVDEWKNRIHPEDVKRAEQDVQAYIAGKTDSYTSELRLLCKDGSYKWMLNRGIAVGRNGHGGPLRMVGTTYDISVTRQSEEARLVQMARQKDVLVREVHHRIKNNLQGVAGLLRQHAGKDPRVDHILDQAIAQIRTVAIVHGLQGQGSDNEVVLCEMVPAITRMAEALLQPTPVFEIQVDVPRRIRVSEQETVPIALILNELIVNAAKHARDVESSGRIGITVCWDRAQTLVRIIILNPGALPPDFDFVSGVGLGTGLDLARSLLPPDGGRLSFSSNAGEVVTTLELCAPSIYNV
ncbi:MAG: sensor histidine kinase [Burkholderiaceae bacterium]